MKRKLLSVFLIGISFLVIAQEKAANDYISFLKNSYSDGGNPFEILKKANNYAGWDYQQLYADNSLKPLFLDWLDREKYLNFLAKKESEQITSNERLINSLIKKYARRNKIEYDSVFSNLALYNSLKNIVIEENIKEYKEGYKNKLPIPPYKAIDIHSLLALPESYDSLKTWWEEQGKPIEYNILFIANLRIGNTESRELFNREIQEFAKSNGKSFDLMEMFLLSTEIRGSYSVSCLLRLLGVTRNFVMLSDGDDGRPFNCDVIRAFLDSFHYYGMNGSGVKKSDSCENLFLEIEQINKSAQELLIVLEQKEFYWKKNLRY